uniref:SID1 transmembrane family member 1 n=2 Tax=Anoplophora glabripennis TaxID=217634 RepID=V5G0U6_ANOGL
MVKQWWPILFIIYNVQGINITSIVIDQQVASYTEAVTYEINATYQVVLFYPTIETPNPFRVKAWSPDAQANLPVLVVVQQESSVTSWQVPLMVETSRRDYVLKFSNTSKTMCHDQMDSIVNPDFSTGDLTVAQRFIVGLSTSSPHTVSISIEMEEEKDFYVELDKSYSVSVSPSEPRYVFYKFLEDAPDIVIVDVDSEDDICLVVSVQDSRCPVFDTNKDIKYEGVYQTINLKGALTITRKDFDPGFFLIFVAKPDNADCTEGSSYLPRLETNFHLSTQNITTSITFKIRPTVTRREYIIATIGTLVTLGAIGIILTILSLVLNRFGTISKSDKDEPPVYDCFEPLSEFAIQDLLKKDILTVNYLARQPRRIRKRSYNYLSHILSIAVFYSIPVVQLGVTYQRIINASGNEDMCYFNFLCAHPGLGFSDFNHIFSNIGYVIFGILFNFVVIDRYTIIKIRKTKGIPVHYGLYHAMGVALIIEGLLSACYHICPSQSNYQFDTSFMYIMAVLCMVKLYQNRHPDINASAYSTFTIVGVAIFLAMLGILNGGLAIWVVFAVSYTALCIVLSFKIYFLNYVVNGVKELHREIKTRGYSTDVFLPIRRGRFIFLLITNAVNLGLLIAGLCVYPQNLTDFGTFLLGLLMANAVLHAIFYTSMKLIHGERICFEAVCYGLLSIAAWTAASVFFLDPATLWTVTPAESRQWNQNCILLGFYDKHDVWHLLSAPGLYFTFMYLMCLDDDIVDKDQCEIPVF